MTCSTGGGCCAGPGSAAAALTAITAAVVGVILNLAVWFAIHTLFARVFELPFAGGTIELPVLETVKLPALLLAVGAMVAVFRFKVGVLPVLGAAPCWAQSMC